MKKPPCRRIENLSASLQQLLVDARKSPVGNLPWETSLLSLAAVFFPDVFASLGPAEPVEVFLWARERLSEELEVGLSSGVHVIAGLDGALQEDNLSALARH